METGAMMDPHDGPWNPVATPPVDVRRSGTPETRSHRAISGENVP